MARKQKVKIIFFILMIGLVLAFMVLAEAFNATIQHENNEYSKTNADIQGEIDTLKVKVKSSNNIENIEKVASAILVSVTISAPLRISSFAISTAWSE